MIIHGGGALAQKSLSEQAVTIARKTLRRPATGRGDGVPTPRVRLLHGQHSRTIRAGRKAGKDRWSRAERCALTWDALKTKTPGLSRRLRGSISAFWISAGRWADGLAALARRRRRRRCCVRHRLPTRC